MEAPVQCFDMAVDPQPRPMAAEDPLQLDRSRVKIMM